MQLTEELKEAAHKAIDEGHMEPILKVLITAFVPPPPPVVENTRNFQCPKGAWHSYREGCDCLKLKSII